MKDKFIFGAVCGLLVGCVFSFIYRYSFIKKLKDEPLDVQAQYKLERIKGILETYE